MFDFKLKCKILKITVFIKAQQKISINIFLYCEKVPHTLYEKLFNSNFKSKDKSGSYLIYIDHHLIYEVTSHQKFEGLHVALRNERKENCKFATVDQTISKEKIKTFKYTAFLSSKPFFFVRPDIRTKRQGVANTISSHNW